MRSHHGCIALITTQQFRDLHSDELAAFAYGNLYTMCRLFDVVSTGGTYAALRALVDATPTSDHLSLIQHDMNVAPDDTDCVSRWRDQVLRGLLQRDTGIKGMIRVGYDLVEGSLGGIIHLVDWSDMNAKADTAVLWREANVHDIPIALDIITAEKFVEKWCARFAARDHAGIHLEVTRQVSNKPLDRLRPGDKVAALIAHDAKKLEMCRFAVENAYELLNRYDKILATGTTGKWLVEFMKAARQLADNVEKILLCNSGPYGGDVQIAYAVTTGRCGTVFFFQDPQASHPHDADIRLFEQATVSVVPHAKLATNAAAAKLLLGL